MVISCTQGGTHERTAPASIGAEARARLAGVVKRKAGVLRQSSTWPWSEGNANHDDREKHQRNGEQHPQSPPLAVRTVE